jgi:hypothetical protein
VQQISSMVIALLPAGARVLVVGKGDDSLLSLGKMSGAHFPQDAAGRYAGYYPADSAAAVAHLEDLRKGGAEYLVFPRSAFWWFAYYPAFVAHLESRYRVIARQRHLCTIYELNGR